MDATTTIATVRSLPFLSHGEQYTLADGAAMTVEQALQSAGLDFEVDRRKVYTHDPKGHKHTIDGWYANVRNDTEAVLGLVGDRYRILQNRTALGIGNVLADTGEALIESAWSLRGGQSVGVTFRIPGADIAVPGDEGGDVQMYGLIRNSHDGNSSVTFDVGPVRLRCLNMIRLFKRRAVASITIRHTDAVERRVAAARDLLGFTYRASDDLARTITAFLNMTLAERDVDNILRIAFPIDEESSDAQRDKSTAGQILANWQSSATIDAIRPTGWGLVNAANEFFEHLSPVRAQTYDSDSVRGISILQGTAMQGTLRVAKAIDAYR